MGGSAPHTPTSLRGSVVEARKISKRFGTFYANRDVSLEIRAGEIHAIAGENGAGKTTLMNVLFGRIRPDSGSVLLRGDKVSFRSPRDAIRAGIGMVHQNILTFPQLTVLENVIAGFEPSRFGMLGMEHAREALLRLQGEFGFRLDPDLVANELSFAQRQQIELLKVLYRGAEILILDEPTSLLSPGETEKLLEILKNLRDGGRTILFISHRLGEVFEIADRIAVLRHGRVLATLNAAQTGSKEIAALMVGQSLTDSESGRGRTPCDGQAISEDVILELRSVNLGTFGTEPPLRNVSLSIRKGEIFGIAGIVGNGQRSLARVLSGKVGPESGSVLLDGADVSGDMLAERIRKGIKWLPENVGEEALLSERPVWENLFLGNLREPEFQRSGILREDRIVRFAEEQIEANNIAAPDVFGPLASLSGGNRQKVALAGTLSGSPRVVIVEQPSRGLDLHASARLHDHLLRLCREKGIACVILSYDLDELTAICDRIAVLYRGEVIGTVDREAFSRESLGRWMAGVVSEEAKVQGGGSAVKA